jgi:uncharacterized protein (UPF0333 family)
MFNLIGSDTSFSTTSAETVWHGTGNYSWLSAAGTLSVVSDSASDVGVLEVIYLDANYTEQRALITLTGTTPVTSSVEDFFRIISATYLVSFGPVGTVTLSVGGTTVSVILAGRTMADDAVWTVPNKYRRAILKNCVVHCTKGSDAVYFIFARTIGGTFKLVAELGCFETVASIPLGLSFPSNTDIEVRAISKTGSSSGSVNLIFELDA